MDLHSVNHVGMAVRSMDAAAARFAALGFVLTPFSVHAGAWQPGQSVRPLGQGNRCIVFPHNYLEILASEDPARLPERLARFLARHQGGHIICFGTDVPDAVDARLKQAGIATSGVIPLQRDVDTPQGTRTAKFARIQFAPDASPEGYIQAAQHLTPEHIHQARYMTHPNGVDALTETFVVVDDVEAFVRRYATYCGVDATRDGPKHVFRVADAAKFPLVSKVSIVATRDAPGVLPGSLLPPAPAIAGVAFRTPRLDALRARLDAAGIRWNADADGRVVVPAEEALGVALVFASD